MKMKKHESVQPGARISSHRFSDGLVIEIARNNRKPFEDHIIMLCITKEQLKTLNRDGVTNAWFIKADGRRRTI
jgi:hypothetical protein